MTRSQARRQQADSRMRLRHTWKNQSKDNW